MTKHLQMIHGRYLVHRQVGSGGFGTVYRADDTLLQRLVALKAISLNHETATVPHRSPLHEARMLASYPHSHIPHVYDVFSCADEDDPRDEYLYIAMEWIEGQRLPAYRQTLGTAGRPQPFLECVRLSIQLCQVVRFLHEQQPAVVLRDIKPENLLVTQAGKLYLVDFGTVKHVEHGLSRDVYPCWSYGYEAPELRAGRASSSPVTDLFSIGVTLYHLFFQQHPIFEDEHPSIEFSACPELVHLLSSLMAKEPNRRPQTVREVQKRLRRLEVSARTQPDLFLKDAKVFGSEPPSDDSRPF